MGVGEDINKKRITFLEHIMAFPVIGYFCREFWYQAHAPIKICERNDGDFALSSDDAMLDRVHAVMCFGSPSERREPLNVGQRGWDNCIRAVFANSGSSGLRKGKNNANLCDTIIYR